MIGTQLCEQFAGRESQLTKVAPTNVAAGAGTFTLSHWQDSWQHPPASWRRLDPVASCYQSVTQSLGSRL